MATLGVNIGGRWMHTVVLDEGDEVISTARMRTPTTGDRTAVVEVIVASVHEAADRAGVATDELSGIGVGSPGVVTDGTVGQAVNVPGWTERFRLAEMLSQQFAPPIRIMNDVTAVAVGEHRLGAGRGADHLIMVWVGTGVGGGLILDGTLYEGAFGAAGEFGHTVVERGGAVCPCGRRGCVEAYIGRRAMEHAARRALDEGRHTSLFRIADELGSDRLTSQVFKEAYDRGDPVAADLIDWGAEALAKGIASAVNLLDVERVVIGGGLADRLGRLFITKVESAARPALFLQPARVEIVSAALGDAGGAIGAALVARDAEGGGEPGGG
ncbi:MAG: ROK family protein [Actinomycetota bacterium]|nr:ROK family protein [Actinomycetota bacterium]